MPNIDNILRENLTPEQYAAAVDSTNEILCLACAGSGKSRTLAYRIARLIAEGSDPKSIVAFTFTEKAAEFIKRRVAEALSIAELPATYVGAMYIGTIHSYCQYLLGQMDARYRQFEVLDENGLKLYLQSRFYPIGLNTIQANRGARYYKTIAKVAEAWNTANDELIDIADISTRDPVLGTVLNNLRANLERDQFIDFSLMIKLVVDAIYRNDRRLNTVLSNLEHLMVDEYQDINPGQEALIRGLHERSDILLVVGDDDQEIYGWRGADVNNILTFEQRHPNCTTHTLSENFRSTNAIVQSADAFITAELSASRIDKNPFSHSDGNVRDYRSLWFDTREGEGEWVARRINDLLGTKYIDSDGTERGLTPGDFAILIRSIRRAWNQNNLPPKHYEFTQALIRHGIDYTVDAEGGIFERPHAIVIRDTFELLRNPAPNRQTVQDHFNQNVLPHFPDAELNKLISIISDWNLKIHTPPGGARRKVYLQEFLHEVLNAFGLHRTNFNDIVLRDLGVFSNIILDVEKVYVSIDSAGRYKNILNFLQNVAETGYDVSTLDLIVKPDAVTVSTVHKMKGLEFPVVFIVDVVNGRFPKNRSNYNGWLPVEVMQNAIDRGAYGTSRIDEARLFYTAMTRGERFLYVTGSSEQPDTQRPKQPSVFKQRLQHQELTDSTDGLPENHETTSQKRRFDETDVPTSYTQIKDYLNCPQKYKYRQHYGFSPPVPELFGFGLTTHTAIGRLHQGFPNAAPSGEQAEEVARETFHLKHIFESKNPESNPGPYERAKDKTVEIVRQYAENFTEDFTQVREVEARFEIKAENALISGTIDLLLNEDDKGNILDAKVIDFKSIKSPDDDGELDWIDLSLQVQLYAHAAKEILGENAKTGAVHLLRDNKRIEIPITKEAVDAAIENIEWAVEKILDDDFPMRPSKDKCESCDFKLLCSQNSQNFKSNFIPPAIHIPTKKGTSVVKAFSDFDSN